MQFKKKLFKKRHGRKRLKILTAAGCIVIAAASAAFYLSSQEEKEDSQETGIQEKISQISEIYTEEYQDSVKERLEKVKASGDYTEEYMLIEPDPFGTNPLSLYVYFKTDGPARVSYCVSAEDEEIADFSAVPASEERASQEHEFQVMGLVPEMTNTVTFTVAYEDGREETFEYIEEDVSIAGEEEIRLDTEEAIENADAQLSEGLMYYSISETKIAAMDSLGMVQEVYDLGDYMDNFVDADSEGLDWIHINTLQYLGDETLILSSRETSSIIKISGAFSEPEIEYMIGNSGFWEGTGYEELLLEKDEGSSAFPDTGGQHSVTYVEDDSLPEGQYYLYMFNNNFGISESRDYDWTAVQGIETSMEDGETSYYYKYLVDENEGTYQLVQSFEVPFSAYVSSAQEKEGNIIIDSGMAGVFGEYGADGNLIREYKMELAKNYIYRVYKYDFSDFLTIMS